MQATVIEYFLMKNFLQMNVQKCELVLHSRGSVSKNAQAEVGSATLTATTASKCLGIWCTSDLSPSKAITENISKAQKAFFSFGCIGAFQGELNPLSSRSVVDTCVMPVLLFSSECWYLTDSTLDKLENSQYTLGKKTLRLSRFHSNTSIPVGLDWPSMRARILIRKLNYLRRVISAKNEKLSS